jgi:hypothetical protein
MSITSSMMSMDLSCLRSDDFVALPDAIINIDHVSGDVDDSQSSDFVEDILLRDDDAHNDFTDNLIVSILKRRTADPLPDGSHEHYQWQGEAGDEDDDIITDIIDQEMNTKGKGEAPPTTQQSSDIVETNKLLVSSTKTEQIKKPRRTLDESRTIEPTDDDILLGRGGHTNIHPGNIRFREKALELSPWYESCSKEQKYYVSNVLIDCMKWEGRRFLEKGVDGLWHEVVGNDGVRKKASQLLREPYIRHTL